MPIDLTTVNGKVRLSISDVDENNLKLPPLDGTGAAGIGGAADPITGFIDQAQGKYTDEDAQILYAAALALEAIAANLVMVRGKTRTLDITTDAAAEAEALRKLAKQKKEEADEIECGTFTFEVAVPTDHY